MKTNNDPNERFFALAISQALLRSGHEIFPEAELSGHLHRRADILLREKNGQLLVVEVKTAATTSAVPKAAEAARKQWSTYKGRVLAAVGVRGTLDVYVDEPLADRIRDTSAEIRVHTLPRSHERGTS